MGSEIVLSQEHTEIRGLSKEIALSQLLPQALRNKPADVMAILLTGKELGLQPMQAIRGIHIISGKASMSADLMGALVKQSPVCDFLTLVESTAKVATYRTKRKGEPGETAMSFTLEQAEAAKLLGNDNWKKYPEAMLRARCLASICRAVYPDVCLGIYDSDSGEVEETPTVASGEKAHVDSVKEKIREAVKPKPADIVEGEIVEEKPAPTPVEHFTTRINSSQSLEELKALVPEIKTLSKDDAAKLRPWYDARKAELSK
jgi:hypothetical protein